MFAYKHGKQMDCFQDKLLLRQTCGQVVDIVLFMQVIISFSDHETELKIVKSRVRELELTLYTQREEV